MKKFNKKLGISLVISCILSCLAIYFNVLAIPSLITSFALAIVISLVTMIQTYKYQEIQDYNPCKFWEGFPAVAGAILVVLFYAIGAKLITDSTSISVAMGLSPIMLPAIGIFFGDAGRILFKAEQSAM